TRWRDGLEWMGRHLPAGSVVLSDPVTSYTIPMTTSHYVVTLLDQHSSPNDSSALRRLLDSRDALDPYATWERTRAIVRRYGVDAIALNDRFPAPPNPSFWGPEHGWYVAARARLDRMPGVFTRVWDTGDFVVYRVRREALDTLATPVPPRPVVPPFAPGRGPLARHR